MKVLIVAKTRRGVGACVGGITWDGRSVRLISADASRNEHAGLDYNPGEVWEIEGAPAPDLTPPHTEDLIVRAARRVPSIVDPRPLIRQYMPPVIGGTNRLFDGLTRVSPGGALYIAHASGVPSRSTMFWSPDQPLRVDCSGKRIRYRYPTPDGGHTLTYVGFQEPLEVLPAGALLRVSLAHWWRPKEHPEEELRCYVQLSGWYLDEAPSLPGLEAEPAETVQPISQPQRRGEGPHPNHPVSVEAALGTARQVLKQTFGFSDFRPTQQDVIGRVISGRDTLVVMPTGGGKSLCYQLPALLFQGLTLVVSPLIALMQDQVTQLRELGVAAAFLNSTLPHQEYVRVIQSARTGRLKILYVAPETLLRPETLLLLEQGSLACLAVDEAHCISEWGHDFRPDYRQLDQVRRRFPSAVCIALTATATPRVREDIRRLLEIEPAGEFLASFNRTNLRLAAQPRRDGLGQTLRFLEQHRNEAGIVYCATREQVNQLAAELQARGWPALPYHAGLDDDVRKQNQTRFIEEDARVMVATVAFGMGIDKPNVRFVLHYHLPRDIESYYQEIGRSGRDGLTADCLLLHSRADAMTIRRFIDKGAASERPGRQARLEAMLRYAESLTCRRMPLLQYFGESVSGHCGACDNCLITRTPAEEMDATEPAQKFLSCIKRLNESFGTAHVIDVLRGSRSEKVLSRGHDRLSTYGIGRDIPAANWRELARGFIEQHLVEQDLQFGFLRLTAEGWQVLKGRPVRVKRPTSPELALPQRPDSRMHDAELFDKLRQLRRDLAAKAGLPPYIIFSDRALVEMATFFPQTEAALLQINGVGETKLARYGQAFLAEIRRHRGIAIPPKEPLAAGQPELLTPWMTVKRRCQEVSEAFAAGASVDQLAAQYEVQRQTIINHLFRYLGEGGQVDSERVLASSRLSSADRSKVLAAFERLGLDRLSPVREALGGEIAYEELAILRLYEQSRRCNNPRLTNDH